MDLEKSEAAPSLTWWYLDGRPMLLTSPSPATWHVQTLLYTMCGQNSLGPIDSVMQVQPKVNPGSCMSHVSARRGAASPSAANLLLAHFLLREHHFYFPHSHFPSSSHSNVHPLSFTCVLANPAQGLHDSNGSSFTYTKTLRDARYQYRSPPTRTPHYDIVLV